MDVIPTISFKITAEIEITKHMCCARRCFADEDVYQRFVKHNYVFSFINCHGICVYIVFLPLIARGSIILPAEVSWKRYQIDDFSSRLICNQPQWWLGAKVPGSSPTQFFFSFFLFFPFFVLLFSINIYINNCYFVKCMFPEKRQYIVYYKYR